ncbi:lipopolysaccharide transport periplasmic protein LptA, partial [Persephonella sp.]
MLRVILLVCALLISVSYAEKKTQTDKPIVIEADTLEYDKKDQIIVYTGNVVVKKDDFTLWSDKLKIFLDQKGDIKKILAVGNVRFVKGNRKGKSEEAEYYKDKNYIILKGNAQLQQ